MKIELYCTCGAEWRGIISKNTPGFNLFKSEFMRIHQGAGHSLCDRKTASSARRKAERDYEKQMEMEDAA